MSPHSRLLTRIAPAILLCLVAGIPDHHICPAIKDELLAPLRAAGASGSWWGEVAANMAAAEYHATRTVRGLQAPNRAQDLRAWFDDCAVLIVPRRDREAPAWQWRWQTQRFGRSQHWIDVPAANPQAVRERVLYARGGALTEWYVNSPAGLEQGFTVASRPPGSGPLLIEGEIDGTLFASQLDDLNVRFLDRHGACVLEYGGLQVVDASGGDVPARLATAGGVLTIAIDDARATYPIIVDPLMTTLAWTAESNQADARLGWSVATAGDVNGDGFSDVVVGVPLYDAGQSDEGRAYVYHGSASGLAVAPAWVGESNQADASFGHVVAPAGDVNGDGYDDVIVGAPYYSNGESGEGRVYVYHGSQSGLAPTPAWVAESNQAASEFGISVATAGDVNGDGFADIIVGSDLYDQGESDEGRAFVYHGSAAGLGGAPAWTAEGNQVDSWFGWSVTTAGDVNGDRFADIVVGARFFDNGETNEGRAFVYHGSAAGLAGAPAWSAEGNQAAAQFGFAVATAGDVNGDGWADAVVGALGYDNGETNEGRAFVYQGSAGGLAAQPAWTAEGNQVEATLGNSVATAGDVNGDGFADVIVGADSFDNGQDNEGTARVYLGSAAGLAAAPVWTGESNQATAYYGHCVATAGDVNGDGYSDVIAGAYYYDNGQTDEGRAFVYHGSGGGLATTAAWTAEANQAGAAFGYSIASAGDVNGDGYSDVIAGVRDYDGGQTDEGRVLVFHGSASGLAANAAWTVESNQDYATLGSAVATAGDVNNDGYSDVIVSAASYDNGETNEGRAFVYHGSAAGLAATPAWTAEGNQAGAVFGQSVATAGDVNGDGFSDVIIGADYADNGETDEGRAYVYLGGLTGLAASPAWTREGNQTGARFGHSVATAGDVNGDGYSDVVVGAYRYDNGEPDEGRAYAYHGSASGLATTASWVVESNFDLAHLGCSVATAGDVNGDGYSDAIVGADEWMYGVAFAYHGTASGLATTPAWTEWSELTTSFGYSVASAGDVNADGYSDVIVGHPELSSSHPFGQAGSAHVYHGSATGLATIEAWGTNPDNQEFAHYGFCVASAGDVNGDGFADIVVSARDLDNGEDNEGRAYLFYGNEGDGLDRGVRMARAADTAPIYLHGKSDSENSFRLKVLGRTPAGRGRVRLEWEVKRAAIPFDGSGLGRGAIRDTGTPGAGGSAAALSELASGLEAETLYRWRLRTTSNSPFFPRSRWLWLPYNAVTEADVRTKESAGGVEEAGPAPRWLVFEPIAPNPLGTATTLRYNVPAASRVRLAVYDVTGRLVALLVHDEMRAAGPHRVRWDGRTEGGRALPAGTYLVELEVGSMAVTQKVVITQ